jgi:hypothetical protein
LLKLHSKNTLLSVTILGALTACGVGGSTPTAAEPATANPPPASGTPAQTPVSNFSYNKILGEYTTQQWDAIALAKIVDSGSTLNSEYIQDMAVSLTENGQRYAITARGGSNGNITLDYSWTVNTDGSETTVALYDPSGFQFANSYQQPITGAELNVSTYDSTWLASQGLEYVDGAAAQATYTGNDPVHTLPIIYGEFTESGDVKTTANQDFTLLPDMLFQYWDNDRSTSTTLVAKGSGNINVNYESNAVTGTVVLNKFYNYADVFNGNTSYTLVAGIPNLTITLVDGTLVDGQITATLDTTVVVTSNGTLSGEGYLKGALFGPEGNELGATLFLLQDNEDTHSYFYWDTTGIVLGQ